VTATGLQKAFTGAAVANPNMPLIGPDKNTTAGSLFLFDAAHSQYGLGGTVPANGAAIPNVLWEFTKGMIPAGSQASLAGSFVNTLSNAEGKLEITGHGGLHVCVTQAAAVANAHQAGIFLTALQIGHLLANWATDEFGFAMHDLLTRPAITQTTEIWEGGVRNGSAGGMANFLLGLNRVGPQPASGTAFTSAVSSPPDPSVITAPATSVSRFRTVTVKGGTGVVPPGAGNITAMMAGWGAVMAFSTAGNKSRSSILYRSHLVNLTKAGMSAEDFNAAELAIWKADTASGGRYDPATETFTPVATFLA